MTTEVASRISEQHEKHPGAWVISLRGEAARRDGRAKPYSQMDLASAIGRDRNTVARWESRGIDLLSWHGMLAMLGIEQDWKPAVEAKPPRTRRSTRKPNVQ